MLAKQHCDSRNVDMKHVSCTAVELFQSLILCPNATPYGWVMRHYGGHWVYCLLYHERFLTNTLLVNDRTVIDSISGNNNIYVYLWALRLAVSPDVTGCPRHWQTTMAYILPPIWHKLCSAESIFCQRAFTRCFMTMSVEVRAPCQCSAVHLNVFMVPLIDIL